MGKRGSKSSSSAPPSFFRGGERLKTPLDHLNIVLASGFRCGTLIEFFGKSKSGKSSLAYQMVASFMKTYEAGQVHILDTEKASDKIRLKYGFGIDTEDERFHIKVTPILEDAFEALEGIVGDCNSTGNPTLVIWDTISVCSTRNDYTSKDQFSGGRQERPRVIKHYLAKVLAKMSGPIWVIIINQVMDDQGSYAPGQVKSGGGHALHHNLHYSLLFKSVGDEDDGGDATLSHKTITLHKSRFCPPVKNIPMVIDVTKGGIINAAESLVTSAVKRGIIVQPKSGWWSVVGDEGSTMRKKDMVKDKEVKALIRKTLREAYCEKYYLLKMEYEELKAARG